MARRLFDLVYAPLAAVLLPTLLLIVCILVLLTPTQALRREVGRAGARFAFACVGVRIRVRGIENLPARPAIVVCNHASYADGVAMTAALPRRYTFVVQDGAAGWPLIGPTIRRMGVAFINREEARSGAKQTRALIRRLQEGESFAVFPEGTFEAGPGLLSFKTGAFLMAARAGVPVVPAAIRGSRTFFGGGRKLPRWSDLDVEIGAPIAPAADDRAAALQLRDDVRAQVLRMSGEPDHAHRSHLQPHAPSMGQ
jgi:1-acyl-sn-glycerol-3-phosphate acyltransferase